MDVRRQKIISIVNQWVGRLGSAARMRASKYDERYGRMWLFKMLCIFIEVIAWNESEIDKF